MIKKKKRKERDLSKFMSVTPNATAVMPQELTKKSYINDDQYPLVIEPVVDDVDLIGWASNNRDMLKDALLKHGAVLFRGFGIKSVGLFEGFAKTILPELEKEPRVVERAGKRFRRQQRVCRECWAGQQNSEKQDER